jgi:FkbM family methyltransferase
MGQLKYNVYRLLNNLVPQSSQQVLGRSRYLRPVRDHFFRSEGVPNVATDTIEFEKRIFRFSAPYQTLAHAKTGIESRLSRLILAHCVDGARCIDVGANYGFISIIMSLAVGPRGRVFSFEPDPFVFNVLEKNISDNNLRNICSVYQKAVGAEPDTRRSGDYKGIPSVTRITIDEFMATQSHAVELIKVDVDGDDFEVLVGAQRVLNEFHPIVIVEMTTNEYEIYNLLVDAGYEYILDMNGNPVNPGSWPPNIIAAMVPLHVPARGSLAVGSVQHMPRSAMERV